MDQRIMNVTLSPLKKHVASTRGGCLHFLFCITAIIYKKKILSNDINNNVLVIM